MPLSMSLAVRFLEGTVGYRGVNDSPRSFGMDESALTIALRQIFANRRKGLRCAELGENNASDRKVDKYAQYIHRSRDKRSRHQGWIKIQRFKQIG